MPQSLVQFDTGVYRAVNGGLTHELWDPFMLLVSSNQFWATVLISAFAWAFFRHRTRWIKILTVLTFTFALSDLLCAYVLKPWFQRVRPCHYMEDARRVNGICGSEFGMPSSHAANGMTAAVIVSFFAPGVWPAGVAAAAVSLTGFSRVYLGVHFPGDVLIGYFFGLVFGSGGTWLAYLWTKEKT